MIKEKQLIHLQNYFKDFFRVEPVDHLNIQMHKQDIPNLTKRRYANYLNFLYNNPDPIGKATGGFIKTTRENLEGYPEIRFLGYPCRIQAVGAAAGGIVGARTAIKTSPYLQPGSTTASIFTR